VECSQQLQNSKYDVIDVAKTGCLAFFRVVKAACPIDSDVGCPILHSLCCPYWEVNILMGHNVV
jgi:hypothetical protein